MNGSLSSIVEPVIPPRSQLALELDSYDKIYDSELCLFGSYGPTIGYHTRLTPKDWVHATRENFQYAVSLLAEGSPTRRERAFDILDTLLPLQDIRDESKTYGIWSWYVEESLEQMNPPDWNWAGFCGLQIGIILVKFPTLPSPSLSTRLKKAIRHCARSIIRRDVKPHYTNIAYLGAAVTLIAGDVLDEPEFILYGRNLLAKIEESLDYHGNYNEYNSPAYTLLLIEFCDQILQTARDQQALTLAEKLRRRTWEIIATYFHPTTAQWAGPQSRSYSVWLNPSTVREISERVGCAIPCRSRSGAPSLGVPPVLERLPCPPEITKRFQILPEETYEVRQRFVRRETETESVWGTTWFSDQACLGSVNHEIAWTQTRIVLGYWKTEQDPAVQLRLRFLHDNRDFASAWLANSQSEKRVLTVASFLVEFGDTHPVFYFPENSEFGAEDFRLRYELFGRGVTARETGDGRFELSAGTIRALIQPLEGTFNGQPITWKLTDLEGGVALDGICYHGPRRTFPFKSMPPAYLALGMQLLSENEPNPSLQPYQSRNAGAASTVVWGASGSSLEIGFSAIPHLKP